MTVSYNIPVRIDESTFLLEWSSDITPPVPFRVYREGNLVNSFTSTTGFGSQVFTIGVGESPYIEVLDKSCSIPTIAFPGKITLNWTAIAGAVSYNVQQWNGSAWLTLQNVIDNGAGVFVFQTAWLLDETYYQWRVVPVDIAGNLGTPIAFSVVMVRTPDVPQVSYHYNGAGTPTVTIS